MPTDPVPGSDTITVIDTAMFGVEGYTASFLLDAEETVLIDTGLSTCFDAVQEGVAEAGSGIADIDAVVVTHVHLDHCGALADVVEASDARVYCHANAERYLTDPDATAELVRKTKQAMGSLGDAYGTAQAVDPDRVTAVEDGDTVDCGDRALEVLHAPGHAPHHIALFEPRDEALFVIDEGVTYVEGEELPTTPPPDFDFEATLESFERFRERDPEVLLYGHYGANPSGADAIDRHERALRDWVESIEGALAAHEDDDTVVEAVAERWAEDVDDVVFQEILRRDVRGVIRYLRGS